MILRQFERTSAPILAAKEERVNSQSHIFSVCQIFMFKMDTCVTLRSFRCNNVLLQYWRNCLPNKWQNITNAGSVSWPISCFLSFSFSLLLFHNTWEFHSLCIIRFSIKGKYPLENNEFLLGIVKFRNPWPKFDWIFISHHHNHDHDHHHHEKCSQQPNTFVKNTIENQSSRWSWSSPHFHLIIFIAMIIIMVMTTISSSSLRSSW